ncbi:MAG: radical SAM family heme chaperone HemW, partial [Planctomycetaceae bacterium]|nr:radical SAM family heme chaperone HemW [Planctomycetaceae bacterium]
MQGLYIHIPFCVKKCGYCDFYSEVASEDEMRRFLAALECELQQRAEQFAPLTPQTVFFGGGTPTRLSAENLRELGRIIHRYVDTSHVIEWTSEINPGTLDAAKADALVEMGVNRASFGVQSFNPKYLADLDRAHEAGKVDEALAFARTAGIQNINVDLIFALPGQTIDEWYHDLEQALALNTQHISLYNLTFEDDTPLTARMERGKVEPLDDETAAEMYELTVARCREVGFARYEVSNFARPGFESRHNLLYWRCGDWLGIGPAAHSACGRLRWANVRDHREYAKALLDDGRLPLALDELGGLLDEDFVAGIEGRAFGKLLLVVVAKDRELLFEDGHGALDDLQVVLAEIESSSVVVVVVHGCLRQTSGRSRPERAR